MRKMHAAAASAIVACSGCALLTDLSGLTGAAATGDGGNASDGGSGSDGASGSEAAIDADGGQGGDTSTDPDALRFVQAGSATAAQTTLTLKAAIAPTTAQHLIVVGVTIDSNSGATVASITDDAPGGGNVYASANQRSIDTSCDDVAEIWYAKDAKAGAASVSVTASTAVRMDMWVLEFSGLDRTNPLDTGAAISNQPTSSTITAPSVTPAKADAVVISTACTCGSITGVKPGTPFTALNVQTGENTAYLIAHTAGSYGAVWTSNSATWNASTVAFK